VHVLPANLVAADRVEERGVDVVRRKPDLIHARPRQRGARKVDLDREITIERSAKLIQMVKSQRCCKYGGLSQAAAMR
jgi:hypothetical protein